MFSESDYNIIQNELQKNTCLESSSRCNNDINFPDYFSLRDYCSLNDNLLTEDVCYHWYTQNIYNSNASDVNIYTQYEEANELLSDVCKKYSYHPKCKCMAEIGDNINSKFSAGSTFNMGTAYPYHCLFNSCQKDQVMYSPKQFTPYIPSNVYTNPTECPDNVCSIVLKDNIITLDNDAVLDIKNMCNNQNNSSSASVSASVFDVFAGKLGIEVSTLYVIIGVFSMIMLVLIIMIVYYIKQINRKKDWQYRVKVARQSKNNTSK